MRLATVLVAIAIFATLALATPSPTDVTPKQAATTGKTKSTNKKTAVKPGLERGKPAKNFGLGFGGLGFGGGFDGQFRPRF